MDFTKAKKAFLVLADGTVFEGKSFGAEGTVFGEVVFTTSMVGYQETLTDPCYQGQMVVQTFPLIGNYGTNDEDYASDSSVVSGYIVREYCEEPSNFRCTSTIDAFMKKHGIVGLYDIDTRQLTRIIREKGVMNGMIAVAESIDKADAISRINAFEAEELVSKVSVKEKKLIKADNAKFSVAVIDLGDNKAYVSELVKRGCDVTLMPYNVSADDIKAAGADGVFISDGPGNPTLNTTAIETVKKLAAEKTPMFGVGLGHIVLALANGAQVTKLKYGHRGASQPVLTFETGRTYITTQNHGYAVENISADVAEVTHINGNDKTCEGIKYNNTPAFSVQFRPETCGGPQDTSYLYDRFIKMMEDK